VGILAVNPVALQRRGALAATGANQLGRAKQDGSQQQLAPGVLLSAESPLAGIDKAFAAAKNHSSFFYNDQQDRSRIFWQAVSERIAGTLHNRPIAMLQRATEIEADWPRAETSLLS
jgi:hypothetical protein